MNDANKEAFLSQEEANLMGEAFIEFLEEYGRFVHSVANIALIQCTIRIECLQENMAEYFEWGKLMEYLTSFHRGIAEKTGKIKEAREKMK